MLALPGPMSQASAKRHFLKFDVDHKIMIPAAGKKSSTNILKPRSVSYHRNDFKMAISPTLGQLLRTVFSAEKTAGECLLHYFGRGVDAELTEISVIRSEPGCP